ncbi:Nucleoside triphosphate hydrolase protein [Mycena sanguinolenta]|uniref:Nucleoside triphosphate hydrolase protein n=1 Tax=Mycena sanguinolenta TaxID=230812 RepID=A0A8H6YHZ7_9AGAR|nr:Nucleoside triphosphate hydrolase protein [Mycena sanguinolenta]
MSISQDLLPLKRHDISVTRVSVDKVSAPIIRPLKALTYVGLSTQLSSNGRLKRLALATCDTIILVSVDSNPQSFLKMRDTALAEFLLDGPVFVAFGVGHIALQIHRDIRAHLNNAVELSTLCSLSARENGSPSKLVGTRVSHMVNFSKIDELWYGGNEDESSDREVALRAWISALLGEPCEMQIAKSLKVNTKNLMPKELSLLGDLILQADAIAALKPKEVPNDFICAVPTAEGLKLENARYQSRVRRSNQASLLVTCVIMRNTSGKEFTGRAEGVKGRITDIKFHRAALTGELAAVRVVGKEELTNAEKARDEFILFALRGELQVTDALFVRLLWFCEPGNRKKEPVPSTLRTTATRVSGLNESQTRTLAKMTSSIPVVIVQGPPGTGKTRTISAAAAVWEDEESPTWIVAQSNVAVKNIAEKLAELKVTFKIIVSKEFYVEWHEHIYGSIDQFLIRTDELIADERGIAYMLNEARIVLSTLSTLSNPGLDHVGIFLLVPVEKLVVDEASQINAFDFMHVFHKFRKSLDKVCFFGDPMQLPPYGREQVSELRSIFDFEHVGHLTEFLDTQYRMPVPIGDFISAHVYSRRLRSQHDIKSTDCVAFIDVVKGAETSSALSWKNPEEIQTICHLVRRYHEARKEFRVITPYDAQRAAIELQLKRENLPHDHVYNVDSFQGNEADYVLVSVVRTEAPGFLRSLNRMNVMLTRAKKGMIIVTSSSFLRSDGAQTLLGRLARYWETHQHDLWIDWRRVADGTADLPGLQGTLSLGKLSLRTALAPSRSIHLVATADNSSTIAGRNDEKVESWQRPVMKELDFPSVVSSATVGRNDKVESWRRPVIKEPDFPPLASSTTAGRNDEKLESWRRPVIKEPEIPPLASTTTSGRNDKIETWRRPVIKEPDFPPLASTSAFARPLQTKAKVISELKCSPNKYLTESSQAAFERPEFMGIQSGIPNVDIRLCEPNGVGSENSFGIQLKVACARSDASMAHSPNISGFLAGPQHFNSIAEIATA